MNNDTPRCNALESNPLDSFDHRAWMTLARKLERELQQCGPKTPLTNEQIMEAACNAADALDATRVSEMGPGGWHATTIFDGDTGLLRFGRLIEKAINGSHATGDRHE